jgi:hypothetical protein
MAAFNCSPAVASRSAKYVNEFRVLMLLGAKIAQFFLAADAHSLSPRTTQPPDPPKFVLA